jgi:hypothetical protein
MQLTADGEVHGLSEEMLRGGAGVAHGTQGVGRGTVALGRVCVSGWARAVSQRGQLSGSQGAKRFAGALTVVSREDWRADVEKAQAGEKVVRAEDGCRAQAGVGGVQLCAHPQVRHGPQKLGRCAFGLDWVVLCVAEALA